VAKGSAISAGRNIGVRTKQQFLSSKCVKNALVTGAD